MKRRIFALCAVLSLGCGLAPAIGAQARVPVIAALKGPTGIGMVRVFDAPPLLPSGILPRLVGVASADVMTAKVISGEYDAAVLPVNMAAKLYNSGIAIRLAAIVGNGMISFLSSDTSIVSLQDLRGKEISVAGQGATPDYLLRHLARGAGLDPDSDLRLSYALPYPEAAAALAAGRIKSAVLPEPFATLALSTNPALRSPLDLGALWTAATGQASYPMSAFVVSSKYSADHPADVKTILAAYRASIEWVTANPAAAGLLVERQELGLKAPIAERAIPRSNLVFIPAPEARGSVEALLRVFLETAPTSVGGALPNAAFYASFN